MSISSTFYVRIFCTYVISAFLVTFWLWQKIHTKNAGIKRWWNRHKDVDKLNLFLTAACCPRRDFYTHTHPPPKKWPQKFVLHTQKNTSFVLHTQKSTQKDFCTAYSKKDFICTAYSKKHSKSRQKRRQKGSKKRLQKCWQKNTPKKHIATYTTHMLIIRKKIS